MDGWMIDWFSPVSSCFDAHSILYTNEDRHRLSLPWSRMPLNYWVVVDLLRLQKHHQTGKMHSESCMVHTTAPKCPVSFLLVIVSYPHMLGRCWHSAIGFSKQQFKLMLFSDTLLAGMWKENGRSYGNAGIFLSCFSQRPENLILTEGEKVEGLLFLQLCTFWHCSNLVSCKYTLKLWQAPGVINTGAAACTSEWLRCWQTDASSNQKFQAHPCFIPPSSKPAKGHASHDSRLHL